MGDEEALNDDSSAKFRTAVLTMLYLPNERPDITSTVRLLFSRLAPPDQKDKNQLNKS